ncbi:DNA N-6-adenine-methyltransferase [Hoeflea sp.]|uniref:DNA N-6-adenine-methyltransferase n=1 Tax=Hoeflea sp. TaxID=1940281 RepID=UPI003B51CA5F
MTRDFGAHLGIGGHHSARARTDVWLTPPSLLDSLGGALSFDLDPCAAPEPRPWPTAREHYALPENGLALPWFGRVWLNPPYSAHEIGRWLARMAGHGNGIALIFARTETASFCRHVWDAADAVLFLEGRLNFHLPNGRRAAKNAGAPSVLCAYGTDNADCLAGSGLEGQFVPLRTRAFAVGMIEDVGTWRDLVDSAMRALGGRAKLSDLYRALAGTAKAARNQHWQAKIRQQLQLGGFERIEPGLWAMSVDSGDL